METKKIEVIKDVEYAIDGIGIDVEQFHVGDQPEVKASVADSMIKNGFAKLATDKVPDPTDKVPDPTDKVPDPTDKVPDPTDKKRSTKKVENKMAKGKKEDK